MTDVSIKFIQVDIGEYLAGKVTDGYTYPWCDAVAADNLVAQIERIIA